MSLWQNAFSIWHPCSYLMTGIVPCKKSQGGFLGHKTPLFPTKGIRPSTTQAKPNCRAEALSFMLQFVSFACNGSKLCARCTSSSSSMKAVKSLCWTCLSQTGSERCLCNSGTCALGRVLQSPHSLAYLLCDYLDFSSYMGFIWSALELLSTSEALMYMAGSCARRE